MKDENAVVDVGCIIERLVAVARFGAPDFWGYVNDKGSGDRKVREGRCW